MKDYDQQFRLRQFWGRAAFSLGILWGVANLVYTPVSALTSIAGSSWFEVAVIFAGGLLTFSASSGAFTRRRLAWSVLLCGGSFLLLLAIAGQWLLPEKTHGIVNFGLLYLAGGIPVLLGIFGAITEHRGWPPLG